jgi:hypothetical protein
MSDVPFTASPAKGLLFDRISSSVAGALFSEEVKVNPREVRVFPAKLKDPEGLATPGPSKPMVAARAIVVVLTARALRISQEIIGLVITAFCITKRYNSNNE